MESTGRGDVMLENDENCDELEGTGGGVRGVLNPSEAPLPELASNCRQ